MKQLANLDRSPCILLVEDNPDDAKLTQLAFQQAGIELEFHVATNGNQALDFLTRREPHQNAWRPDLIFLDLNLPGTDGREVLQYVKGDVQLRRIPVIILTTSEADVDLVLSYGLHANAYLTKPIGMDEWDDVVRGLSHFWFNMVKLPPDPKPKLG